VSEKLADLEQQIIDKEAEIAQTQSDLAAAREKEAWQYDCMEKRIQLSYEKMGTNFIEALLQAESFADILNLTNYVKSMVEYDNQKLDEIIETRKYIESEEARLEQENEELKFLRLQAEAEQSRVNELIDQTSKTVASYASQIKKAEEEALKFEAAMKELESDLKALKKKLEEEIRLSQQAANGVWRDISEVSFADGDLKLLANLIYCEAGGEPYEGKLAVGAVVINRVRSAKFPGTVVGVIYQKKQFSPVASGRLDMYLAIDKANADCYRAAQEAMAGLTNVGNCLFFRTPIEGLTGISIGGHIFY
jgi:spore germination cell wall hydrolase CwlJ-like protein